MRSVVRIVLVYDRKASKDVVDHFTRLIHDHLESGEYDRALGESAIIKHWSVEKKEVK